MKSTGIIRRIDECGKIVIPASMRRTLNINAGDAFEISWQDGVITMRKMEERCVFCNKSTYLTEFRGKFACWNCIEELKGELSENY